MLSEETICKHCFFRVLRSCFLDEGKTRSQKLIVNHTEEEIKGRIHKEPAQEGKEQKEEFTGREKGRERKEEIRRKKKKRIRPFYPGAWKQADLSDVFQLSDFMKISMSIPRRKKGHNKTRLR